MSPPKPCPQTFHNKCKPHRCEHAFDASMGWRVDTRRILREVGPEGREAIRLFLKQLRLGPKPRLATIERVLEEAES